MARLLALLFFFFFALAFCLNHVSVRNSTGCPAYYDHTTHWCASNQYGSRLCEIVDGVNYFLCGNDTCYNHLQYSCNGLSISELGKATGSFHLQVYAPKQSFDYAFIQASGRSFTVGGSPASYCPFNQTEPQCKADANTLFFANALSVFVPGGQQIFIQKSGMLSYTGPHSAFQPDMIHVGENVAYKDGGYFGPEGSHWAACKAQGKDDETSKIFADIPEVDLTGMECQSIFLAVNNNDVEAGTFGAWEYT